MFRKSQITVFIIIVLVILMMTGVVYYIIGSRTEEKGEERIIIQQISAAKVDPLREYVTSCLSLTSSEGLELIGAQGGYIYKSQGGIVDDPLPSQIGITYAPFENTMARYGINKPLSNVGAVFFADPPEYPWPTFPRLYHPITGEYRIDLTGYYGRNKIPPLNRTEENSIPEQLEEFTANEVMECANWASFVQQGLNITTEEINVSVLFAEADVTFTMKWPLEVNDLATGATTRLENFVVVYPIRLQKILDFTLLITEADVTDVAYDIKASDGIITSYIAPDVFGKDDLVTIRDSESRMLDQQYEFRFIRQNRVPALYYIPNITGTVCNGSLVEEAPPNILRIIDSCEANSFELNFTVIDPDEDIINFTYSKVLPHVITILEAEVGEFRIAVIATDGEYEDSQEITIPVRRG